MVRNVAALALVGWVAGLGQAAPFEVKSDKAAVPEVVAAPIQEILGEEAIVLSQEGNTAATFWLRAEVPAPLATPAQVEEGIGYRQVPHTTVMGVVKLDQPWADFRNQEIPAGVYTLRLAFQPQDGDHMGTAPFNDFFLLLPAKLDQTADKMDVRDMQDLSAAAPGGTHPGVMLLFPVRPSEDPTLVDQGDDIWTLNVQRPAKANDQDTILGLGIVVAGRSASE